MGLITTVFWYAFPYVLASVIGFFVAETWNNRTNSRTSSSKSDHRSKQSIDLSKEQQTSKADQDKNGHIQQAKLEACDPGDDGNKSDEGDEDDTAFNLHEGRHIPYKTKFDYTTEEIVAKSRQFYEEMNDRRSVRFFSTRPVPLAAIENIVRTAGTGPSGAHTEPWTYSVVRDQSMKDQIREIIEEEEKINYEKRMGNKWLTDLKPIGTTYKKPYLSMCSTLIVIFKQVYSYDEYGQRKIHYYHEISTAISVGLMLAAIQNAGLVTCTTTPMNAGPRLRKLLGRESYEKVLLLLPVGYAADNAMVPDFHRKPLEQIMDLHD